MILTNPISAPEVGTLWLTYTEKTLIMRVLEYFIEKSDDQQARNITGGLWQELNYFVLQMEEIFRDQKMVKPVGYTEEDVNLEAPKLYDNGFDIMFVRVLKEVSMGMYTINMNMAYNDKVMQIYEGLTTVTQKIYKSKTMIPKRPICIKVKNFMVQCKVTDAYTKTADFKERKPIFVKET